MDAEEKNQSEVQIGEVTVDTLEHFDMQTKSLCMNVGDDDMLQQCYREIALLEYLLINSEYDREIAADERVQYSEREQKDILEIDGKKVRLADSLMVNANQHTDMLTEKLGRNSK